MYAQIHSYLFKLSKTFINQTISIMIYLKLEGAELRVSLSTISLQAPKSLTIVDRESLVKAQPILKSFKKCPSQFSFLSPWRPLSWLPPSHAHSLLLFSTRARSSMRNTSCSQGQKWLQVSLFTSQLDIVYHTWLSRHNTFCRRCLHWCLQRGQPCHGTQRQQLHH